MNKKIKIILNYADFNYYLIVVLSALSKGCLPVALAVFPKLLIDELITTKNSLSIITLLVIFFIAITIINAVSNYVSGIAEFTTLNVRMKALNELSNHVLEMPFVYTENPDVLNKMQIAFNATGGSITGLEGALRNIISLATSFSTLICFLIIMSSLNLYIALLIIISALITYYFDLKAKNYAFMQKDKKAEAERRSNYFHSTLYDFKYGKDLRIYKMKNWLLSLYKKFQYDHINIDKSVTYKNLITSTISATLSLIKEGAIYIYLIYNIINSSLSVGDFVMYFAVATQFSTIINTLIKDFANLKTNTMYMDVFKEFIEIIGIKPENKIAVPKGPYEIEFKNISFKYPGSDTYVYKNLSLKIPKLQKLALVGVNGAGKTTFVKLLTRLYKPTSGEILLNGINIEEYDLLEYFKIFSVVFQEVKTLALTLAENISSVEDYNKERVLEAIRKADLEEAVCKLPLGIENPILKILDDRGIELSGGNAQKVALARAIYKDGGIIVLDEPTSALDAISEYQTYLRFNEATNNKTAIYISHRLASTRFCDTIVVIEKGELVEFGDHESLLKKNGIYKEMFDLQAKYYQEGGYENENA